MENLIINFGIPLFLLLVGWSAGRFAERRHVKSLERRERELSHMIMNDLGRFPANADPSRGAALVMGDVVIASDYMKSFLAGIRKILGGELKSYQSLMSRACREAIVRMLEQAHAGGYDAVCNVRLDWADIAGVTRRRGAAMVTVLATGTAYKTARGPQNGATVS